MPRLSGARRPDNGVLRLLERTGRCLSSSRDLKHSSVRLTGDPTKAPHLPGSWAKMAMARGNLRATGWTDDDFKKPIVTIGSPWTNANPCNNRVSGELSPLALWAMRARFWISRCEAHLYHHADSHDRHEGCNQVATTPQAERRVSQSLKFVVCLSGRFGS
jgi:hypothetical protein